MFGKPELEEIRRHKEALVCQCDIQRAVLAMEYQRLRSPSFWMGEAGKTVSRHPLWTAVLGASAGLLAFKALGKPGRVLDWLGRLNGLSSSVVSLFKLFTEKQPPEQP